MNDNKPNPFDICVAWLRTVQRTKHVNRKRTSYGYKHTVEHWTRHLGTYCYIPNDVLIKAAISLGFVVKDAGHSNVYLNISRKSYPTSILGGDHAKDQYGNEFHWPAR